MAIATTDGLIAALATGVPFPVLKNVTPQAAGCWMSLWNMAGIPGAPTYPAPGVAGEVPNDASSGAFPFTNPGGGLFSYLGRLALGAGAQGVIYMYDQLWRNSGLSTTSLTSQTVNSVALDRPDANGVNAEAWFQVYGTAMGAGATAPSITYTDSGGTGSNTATPLGWATTAAIGRAFPFQLAAGDLGVKSIQSYINNATLTSGAFGLVIRRRVVTLSVSMSVIESVIDAITGGMPRIYDDACLEFIYQASGTAAINIMGEFKLIQG